jgi:MFS transporter, ACS family, solute carrier family 17 (sodium-dependent inorganic phosphate cotransporter), member 5
MCCLMPIASYLDYHLLVCLRVLQGIICSAAWPSMHHMSGNWVPPDERSSFVSSYLGSSMGVAVFYPTFGFIMQQYSWEYVFHFCGAIGLIWFICWNYFVYDTPSLHPRIDPIELSYIHEKLGSSLQLKEETEVKRRIPWRQIIASRALWVNTAAQFGGIWGLFTILTQGPSYFRFVHGWSNTKVGIFSGLPHLLRTIVALVVSNIADYGLRNEKISRDNVRKIGTTICCTINGLFVLGLAYVGCDSTLACVFIILATGCHGAVSTGPLASIIDNSPNFAGVLLGIVNMFCVIPGFVSPLIVSYLTFENQSIESWRMVFLITSAMLITSGVIYIFFSDSSRQEWNKLTPKTIDKICDDENAVHFNGEDQEMLNK